MRFPFVLVLFLLSRFLLAQEQDTLAWSISLEDVVVTAQYAPTSAEEAVHRIEVIKAEEWQQRGLNTLSDVLQQQLNMQISSDPVLGNGLSIQGLGGQNVQIMIDGVPVIGRLGGNIDLNQLNLSQFERVEIVTGSLSAQYGSNASGGVVNLISKKHQLNTWNFEAGAQLESFGIENQFARLGRKFGPIQIDGGINRYVADFANVDELREFREVEIDTLGNTRSERVVPWNPKDQFGYDVNLSYRPTDSLSFRYGYRAFNEELIIYDEVRRPVFRPYANDQFFTTRRRDHNLSVEYWLNDKWYWQTTAGLNRFDRLKDTRRLDFEPDTTSQVAFGQDTTVYTGTLLRTSISRIGKGPFSGRFGLEYFGESGAGGRILDTATNETEPDLLNVAGWINLQYQAGAAWTIEANLRGGYNSRYSHPLIPALNVLWQPKPNLQWRIGYARGFRAPSVQELFFNFIDINHYIVGSQTLAAERAHNLRADFSWQSGGDERAARLSVEAALFYNRISDRITLVEYTTGQFTYGNLDEYETHGVNLGMNFRPAKNLELRLGGAYTRLSNPANEEDSSLDRFIGLSEMSNSLAYRIDALLMDFRIVHRYVGRRDRYTIGLEEEVERGFIEDFHLVDLTVQQSYRGKITLGAGIKNLFDQQRVAVTSGAGGGAHSGAVGSQLVAFGRNFFVRVGVNL
ncbi:hypothetical protein CEQ90_01035 [Lewinellaceae bacterium SD302]|nr:hypothetical protein CEQ90_01035 [Lewinellaceae bacterium SD302]